MPVPDLPLTAAEDLPILAAMDHTTRQVVAERFVPVTFRFGEVIVRKGDAADAYFVLLSGMARALTTDDDGEEITLNRLGAGDGFGAVALLEDTTRTATVRASSAVDALRLDRTSFRALVQLHPDVRQQFESGVRRYRVRDFLRLWSPLGALPDETLEQLIGRFESLDVPAGTVLLRQGEGPGPVTVLVDGRAREWTEQDGARRDIGFLRTGDVVGDRHLVRGGPPRSTVEAVSPCATLRVAPEAFLEVVAAGPALRALVEQRIEQRAYKVLAHVPLDFAEELLPVDAERPVSPEQLDAAPSPGLAPEDGAALDAWEAAAPAPRRRGFPFVWQVDEMDCGAACVAMVCRAFGRNVSMTAIRNAVGTGMEGTSLAGIARGGEQLGLAVRRIKASKDRVADLPLPAILHWGGNHWVVLYEVGERHVRIADPAFGLRRRRRVELDEEWSGYAALARPTDRLDQAPVARSSFGWILPFFRPYLGTLAAAFGLGLAAAALQMTLPAVTQVVVDDVLPDRDYGLLSALLAGLGGAIVFITIASVLQRYLLSRAAVRIDGTTLHFLTNRLFALPMSYFGTRRTGDIQRRLSGVRQVRALFVQSGVRALTAVTQLAAALVLMVVYDWVLALVFVAAVPVYAVLMRFSSTRLRPLFDGLEQAYGRYQSAQIDAIEGMETVKAIGAEDSLSRWMLAEFNRLRDKVFQADFMVMLYEAAIQLVAFLSLALFLGFGALRVLDGELTIGEFVSFNALVALANAPIVVLLSTWDDVQFSSVLLGRLSDVLEQEPEQGHDHGGLAPVPTMGGAVRFRDVGFHFPGAEASPILQGVSLDVAPGTRVAFVGRSGSGKTTLVRLLAGLLEPTQGAVLYDGVDMRTLDYRQLRRKIGYVLQESYVFDDTIARNIALGEDRPVPADVEWAALMANAHEFISRLPLGYETRIGESGLLLSGGQRQRIAIARALYRKPPVLIFDEATSALDAESERALQDNLDGLFEGRTAFVVAHRLSTIRDADLIVVLDKGRIAEQGDHADLMKRQGIYYYLVRQQVGG